MRCAGLMLSLIVAATPAAAAEFAYNRDVSLKVGQSIVLKGVRAGDCGEVAPSWQDLSAALPKPRLGSLSDGGTGVVDSRACKGRVAARGVRFTARKPGSESFVVFDDKITVTVKQ